jgi:protein-disulfide isomerase
VELVRQRFGPKLRFVFRHFPLKEVHPLAESAAEVAEFAGAHSLFWEMHDGLYQNQDKLGLPLYFALAERLELSTQHLSHALAVGQSALKVQNDFIGGVKSGVNGTPTFFINGQRHDGTYAFEDFVAAVERHLFAKATL